MPPLLRHTQIGSESLLFLSPIVPTHVIILLNKFLKNISILRRRIFMKISRPSIPAFPILHMPLTLSTRIWKRLNIFVQIFNRRKKLIKKEGEISYIIFYHSRAVCESLGLQQNLKVICSKMLVYLQLHSVFACRKSLYRNINSGGRRQSLSATISLMAKEIPMMTPRIRISIIMISTRRWKLCTR